jgi:hypothetical protein
MCTGPALPTPPVICEQRLELPFIPNFIGKIHVRFTAGGEVQSCERVKFIKKHPV